LRDMLSKALVNGVGIAKSPFQNLIKGYKAFAA
jgi:hypothetical protein